MLNRLLFWTSCVILIACMIVSFYNGNYYFLTAAWTLPATLLVTSLYNIELKDGFINRQVGKALFFFGNVSFEFFLIHQLVIRYLSIIVRKLSLPDMCAYITAFIMSILCASIMHFGINNIRKMKLNE